MAPKTSDQQIATLPIQVPPQEHLSLNAVNLTCIEYRGKGWYAKLQIERETADQLVERLVNGEEVRGGCTFVCKKRQRNKAQEWRLSCCFGEHDKSARKIAASAGPPLLVKAVEGTASNIPGVAAVRKVQDHVGEKQEDNPGVKKDRRKKVAAGQSIKVGCKFTFSLQTKDSEPGVLLVRVCEKEHVDANGQPAHPHRMCPNLSEDTKDWVYEKLLSGTPARTIIDGTIFSCAICSCLVANAVGAGR
jgi:hypothetical protein